MALDPKAPGFASLARVLGEGVHSDLTRRVSRARRSRRRCVRARAAHRSDRFVGSILVSTQTIGGVAHVSITDNGETFEADAFRELYTVIQQRPHRRGQARARRGGEPSDVVGTFGAALMAAFLVADRITITSRAHDRGADRGRCGSRATAGATSSTPRSVRARPARSCSCACASIASDFGSLEVVREALAKHALEIPFRDPGRRGSRRRSITNRRSNLRSSYLQVGGASCSGAAARRPRGSTVSSASSGSTSLSMRAEHGAVGSRNTTLGSVPAS